MIKLKHILERMGDQYMPSFKDFGDLLDFLDEVPKFLQYKLQEPDYDGIYYIIPQHIWHYVLGWSQEQINVLNNAFHKQGEGYIKWVTTDPHDPDNDHTVIICTRK